MIRSCRRRSRGRGACGIPINDRRTSHPRDNIPFVYRADFYASAFGAWVNERERQAIEDRQLDPFHIYLVTMARQSMSKMNDYLKTLHAYLPKEVVCYVPSY